MNLSTTTRPLALIAAGALALAGCAAAEPAPAIQYDWTESDDFINLALEMAWIDTSAEDRSSICWGTNILGEDWFEATWDETSGASAQLAYEFFEEKCS